MIELTFDATMEEPRRQREPALFSRSCNPQVNTMTAIVFSVGELIAVSTFHACRVSIIKATRSFTGR